MFNFVCSACEIVLLYAQLLNPKPNLTLSKDYSSSEVQFAGLFIIACDAALNVERIHYIGELSEILEIDVLSFF